MSKCANSKIQSSTRKFCATLYFDLLFIILILCRRWNCHERPGVRYTRLYCLYGVYSVLLPHFPTLSSGKAHLQKISCLISTNVENSIACYKIANAHSELFMRALIAGVYFMDICTPVPEAPHDFMPYVCQYNHRDND